jgi:beta-glucosidase
MNSLKLPLTDRRRGAACLLLFLQTLRAIADGADVRGFYYWTLVDNFEWNAGGWQAGVAPA